MAISNSSFEMLLPVNEILFPVIPAIKDIAISFIDDVTVPHPNFLII